MSREIGVDDVVHGKPEWGTLMWRGLTKRCPRCGSRHVYDSWFHMKERCPKCGLLFEREPGFFVGAYLINFAIAEGLLFILIMGFVFWKDQHPEAGVGVPVAIAVFLGVVAPILFYPFSRTIWSALDIGMTPLELGEIVSAADSMAPTESEEQATSGDGSVAAGPVTSPVTAPSPDRDPPSDPSGTRRPDPGGL